MADDIDATDERIEFDRNIDIQKICKKAKQIEPGLPGECSLCGFMFNRLVKRMHENEEITVCGKCRDLYGLS